MDELMKELIAQGYLKTPRIIQAFSGIRREEFIPGNLREHSNINAPLPIGYGQTISQPLTVAFMVELLDPLPGHNILDVGSGSGWTTAILSHIVGPKGKVTAIERIEELKKFGEQNAEKFGFVSQGIAEFHIGDGIKGFMAKAPYDRILVSAMADEIPSALKAQLKIGGKMVIPIHDGISFIEKKGKDKFSEKEYPGFTFVPLVN